MFYGISFAGILSASVVAVVCASTGYVWGASTAETYRLVQAIGNTERITAKGLSKAECEARKRELKAVGEAVGTHNARTGRGSITCLPDRLFDE
jgi:hypothetical protein